jgi:outer membrane protein assembly factor BamB
VSLLGIAVLGSTLLPTLQVPQDWPQWLGPSRDAVWREDGILERFPDSGLSVKWRTPIKSGFSGPSVAGGRVFVTDFAKESGRVSNQPSVVEAVAGKERVLCLDAGTGKPVWEHAYEVSYKVSYPSGPRASPVVSDGRVYTLGTDGDLLCLDVEKGKILWSKRFRTDYHARTPVWGHSAHPLVYKDLLICLVGAADSIVVAFDKETGKERWKALSGRQPGYAPPVLAHLAGKDTLLVWHPASLNALDPKDGKVRWSLRLRAAAGMSVTAPLVDGNKIYVAGIGTRPTLVQVHEDGKDADFLWRGHSRKGIITGNSTPVLYDGVLYGADTKGRLMAASFETGEQLWSTYKPTTGAGRMSYWTFFLVRHQELFFLFTEQGDLILAELSEDGCTELGRFHVLEPTTETYGRKVVWSHPAFAQKCMFARNDKEIVCVSLARG